MGSISEQRDHPTAPARQWGEVIRAVFQDGRFFACLDEIRDGFMPSSKHLLELAFPSASRVELVWRDI